MPTLAETVQKINEFAELPDGWHFGEGTAPSKHFRDGAILLLRVAKVLGIEVMNAFPGIHGEVQITFYRGESVLEIDLELDGSITIAEDEGRRQVSFEENQSGADAINKLREFAQRTCDTSDLFIGSITTHFVKASPAARWIYEIVNQSPSLNSIVLFRGAGASVSTFQPSIEARQASLPSTGLYQTDLFPRGASSFRVEKIPGTIATTISTVGIENTHEQLLSNWNLNLS